MPGFNRTGPRGMGPMTGRGMGSCAMPASGVLGWWRGGGRGAGFGRGWGVGRGFYGRPYPDSGYPAYPASASPVEERAMLRDQSRAMQEEMKRIQARLDELDG